MPRLKINNPLGINGERSEKTEFHFVSTEKLNIVNDTVESVLALDHYRTESVSMLVPLRKQFPQINPIDPQYQEVYQPFMVQASRCQTSIPILTQAIDITIKKRSELAEIVRKRLNK